MSVTTLRVIEWIGVLATIALSDIVIYLNDGAIAGTLVWLLPLLALIQFGCFAHQDRIHQEKKKSNDLLP